MILTRRELADLLHVHLRTVDRWVSRDGLRPDGSIRRRARPRQHLFTPSSVAYWLRRHPHVSRSLSDQSREAIARFLAALDAA